MNRYNQIRASCVTVFAWAYFTTDEIDLMQSSHRSFLKADDLLVHYLAAQ